MRSATKRIIMHSLMSILERKSMDEITGAWCVKRAESADKHFTIITIV